MNVSATKQKKCAAGRQKKTSQFHEKKYFQHRCNKSWFEKLAFHVFLLKKIWTPFDARTVLGFTVGEKNRGK